MTDEKNNESIVHVPADETELSPNHVFFDLLDKPSMGAILTTKEKEKADQFQNALHILGPAAGGALVCPGNQETTPDDKKCPYSAKCVYLKAKKAPAGMICPIEGEEIENRFLGWCRELGKNPLSLTESERAFVSEVVWIAVQEYRCASIVSKGEDARLYSIGVKEAHPDTLEPILWEKIIHVNLQLLELLSNKRRILLKDWMLTAEQKFKKDRASGNFKGKDLSVRQSALADRLVKLDRLPDEDVPHNDEDDSSTVPRAST
jgi:hypothetical protein